MESQDKAMIASKRIAQGPGSNLDADSVDGIHANTIPMPNCLVPLGTDGLFPITVIPAGSSVTMGGDITGLSSAATVAKINGVSLGATTATSGNVLIGSGTAWVTKAISGDATLSSLGAITLANSGVTAASYGDSSHVAQITFDAKGRATTASNVSIASLAASVITSGLLALARGGTNADLSATGGTSQVLKQVSTGAAITVAQLAFTDISGTATVAQGGTGQTSYTNGQLLIGNTSGNTLTKATLTGTSNQVVVTNGTGTITLSTPQSIGTTSDVAFNTVTSAFFSKNSNPGASGIINVTSTDEIHWRNNLNSADKALGKDTSDRLTWAGTVIADASGLINVATPTGVLPLVNGGTGNASASANAAFNVLSPMTTIGDVIYGAASGVGTRLAGNTTSTKKFLRETGSAGVATAPAWDTIVLADLPLTSAHLIVGNGSAVGADVAASGDVTLLNTGAFTVTKLQGFSVDSTTPSSGQVLQYGSSWGPVAVSSLTGVVDIVARLMAMMVF